MLCWPHAALPHVAKLNDNASWLQSCLLETGDNQWIDPVTPIDLREPNNSPQRVHSWLKWKITVIVNFMTNLVTLD